ncbi:MAG: hypothetical protein K9H61_01215 [Bacteroidia bacterium]|nr:hypothetical protein [Bacteroidia bacterium]MCF8426795.1 hypothetical protein [Bacteroidia bacterium]MCF8445587.1 hypothetical protein [Bacteroidia bacterium]
MDEKARVKAKIKRIGIEIPANKPILNIDFRSLNCKDFLIDISLLINRNELIIGARIGIPKIGKNPIKMAPLKINRMLGIMLSIAMLVHEKM